MKVRQPIRRRSLLAKPKGSVEKPVSLLRSLVIAFTAVSLLWLVFMLTRAWLGEGEVTMEGVFQSLKYIAIFAIPITTFAYYGTQFVNRRFADSNRVTQWLGLLGVWLMSGAIGSMIGYEIVYLMTYGTLGFSTTTVGIMIIANGLIAIIIGGFLFLYEAVGPRIGRRVGLLEQENLLTAELQAARSVQQSLLPDEEARIYGFDISGAMAPAVEIGGDYYDYVTFADGKRGIVVADAAGKGVPAALVMAKFQGMAQALSIHVPTPEEFFIGLNDTLRLRLDKRSFITVGMLTIDFEDQCSFYRAGHNPLLYYRAGADEVQVLKPSGIGLGLTHGSMLGKSIEPDSFRMESGDTVLLYSDGLSEAINGDGDEFGDGRIVTSLRDVSLRYDTAVGIRNAILDDLADFVGDAEPHDDITVVVVRKM